MISEQHNDKTVPGLRSAGRRPSENGEAHGGGESALALAQEQIRGLEEQVKLLEAQLNLERERNTGLEEVCRKERAARDRIRRVSFTLSLAIAGLLGTLGTSILATRRLPP